MAETSAERDLGGSPYTRSARGVQRDGVTHRWPAPVRSRAGRNGARRETFVAVSDTHATRFPPRPVACDITLQCREISIRHVAPPGIGPAGAQ
jgi:hypothetical protein